MRSCVSSKIPPFAVGNILLNRLIVFRDGRQIDSAGICSVANFFKALRRLSSEVFTRPPLKGKSAVRVINHYGDEGLKVFRTT